MNSQPLQLRLKEIQGHIDDFKEALVDAESYHRTSLEFITDPALRSSMMEHHVIQAERQKVAIEEMERLYGEVQDHLASLDKPNS